jgi:hypothetical protein
MALPERSDDAGPHPMAFRIHLRDLRLKAFLSSSNKIPKKPKASSPETLDGEVFPSA